MNKKMRELLTQMEGKTKKAKGFMAEGENKDVAKATELLSEVDELTKEFEAEKKLFELEKSAAAPTEKQLEGKKEVDAVKEFADAARKGFAIDKSMSAGSSVDGGYTIPEDIQTRINTWREAKTSLLSLVRVEKVSTPEGQRTFKKRSQQTGFAKVGEGAKIGAKATPQFERLSYKIEKYAGYFPMTNELLSDTDQNITGTLVEWIGDESRVTANKLILEQINKKAAVALKGLDDIKKALNVTLGQAFKATSKIITNDDGLQYLDTLKDAEGKYLLQPNPADPMKMQLCAGATTIPVTIIPNADLATTGSKIPFIIGDLNEAIVYWDRALMSIVVSNIAAIGDLNAFEEDLTIYRAIEREDVTQRDVEAYVNGYIEVEEGN